MTRPNDEPLKEMTLRFMNAGYEERRKLVLSQPDLLGPGVDSFLAGMAWRQKGEGSRAMLESAREQLRICREKGVEAAFPKSDDPVPADEPSPELIKLTHAFLTAPGGIQGKKAFLLSHPELLMEEVDQLLQRGGDERTTQVLESFRTLLARCREVGIEAAFAEREEAKEQGLRYQHATGALIELLQAHNPFITEQIIRSCPDVVAEEFETMLRSFGSQHTGDRQFLADITSLADLLKRCREDGLDQVFGKACSDEDEYNALLHALINLEEFANKDARANSMMIDSSRNLLQHPHTEKDPKAKAFIRWTLGKALLRERGEADEQAIAVLEEAAQDLGPGEHPALFAQIQMDLGTYFANRATSDRESNQTRALISYRSALDALTPEHDAKQFAGISVNMGLLLMDYVGGNRFANIEAAVKRFETALKACNETTDAETYASIQGGLGIAYFKRLIGSRRDNLATAITHYEEALRVRRTLMDPQSCIGILTNLALAYRSRSRFEPHRTEDLEKAIDCLHTALSLADRDEDPRTYALVEVNLAGAYAELPDTHPFEPTKLAPATYRNALSRLDPDVHADEYAGTSRSLAAYYFKRRSWEEAASAYARALSAVERLYSLHFFRTGRAHVLRSVTGFYDEMAYVLAQLGRVEEALEIAERGKTRFVREQTRLRALRPEGVPDDVWEKYSFAAYSLRNLEWEEIHLPGSPEGKPQWFQRATQELEDAVAAVQVYAPSFCQERSVPALLSSVLPERSAAVIVCVTELGGIAFALQEGGPPLVIDLPAFTSSFLQQLLFGEPSADDKYVTRGWIGSYARHSTDGHPRLEKWLNEFDRLLVKVGEHFCGPLSAALPPEITDLVLVVPGALSLLPLHAAPLAVQDAATLWEKYNVSYAPSLTILAACHERWPRSHDSTLYASIDPRVDATLPFAALEGDLIRHHFPQTTVHARSEATREHAARGISSAAITHFACHAEFDWRSPRTSGLQLADGTLTVDELLLGEVNVGTVRLMEGEGPGQEGYLVTMIQPRSAVLVILSACETALIDFMEGNPDEFIGVPTGFLLSGIPCVVSSLWSVADVSTALLMNRFHALVAAGASVAAALRDASFWLRDATASELAIILAKERDRLAVENSPLYPEASFAWRRMLGCPRDSRPFAEPFYHAAFVAGGIAWRPVLPNEKRPHATAPAS